MRSGQVRSEVNTRSLSHYSGSSRTFKTGSVTSNKYAKGPLRTDMSLAVSPLLLVSVGLISRLFRRSCSVSFAWGLTAARWRGVCPLLVAAFMSLPASRRISAQVWWFQRQAEWRGSQPSAVLADTEAPAPRRSCGGRGD